MISKTILGKNMISVRDTQMRRILQNMMNYIYWVEWFYTELKNQVENPEVVKNTVNGIQGQFAEKMIEMNNIINKKFLDMDSMIKGRLLEMETTILSLKKNDSTETKEQVEQLTKLVLQLTNELETLRDFCHSDKQVIEPKKIKEKKEKVKKNKRK